MSPTLNRAASGKCKLSEKPVAKLGFKWSFAFTQVLLAHAAFAYSTENELEKGFTMRGSQSLKVVIRNVIEILSMSKHVFSIFVKVNVYFLPVLAHFHLHMSHLCLRWRRSNALPCLIQSSEASQTPCSALEDQAMQE